MRQGPIAAFVDSGSLQQVIEDVEVFSPATSARTPENEADQSTQRPFTKHNRGARKLIEEEARAEGNVSLRTYWTYIKAAGLMCWVLTLTLVVLIRLINIGNQVEYFLMLFSGCS